jgi:hypothetical protein
MSEQGPCQHSLARNDFRCVARPVGSGWMAGIRTSSRTRESVVRLSTYCASGIASRKLSWALGDTAASGRRLNTPFAVDTSLRRGATMQDSPRPEVPSEICGPLPYFPTDGLCSVRRGHGPCEPRRQSHSTRVPASHLGPIPGALEELQHGG